MEKTDGPWLHLRIEALRGSLTGTKLDGHALVTTGYRAPTPHLVLPTLAAQRLAYWPLPPEGAEAVELLGVGGTQTLTFSLPDGIRVTVMTPDRERTSVVCGCIVVPGEKEMLISNNLADLLGIVILSPGCGLWCFRDELGKVERPSEAPQLW